MVFFNAGSIYRLIVKANALDNQPVNPKIKSITGEWQGREYAKCDQVTRSNRWGSNNRDCRILDLNNSIQRCKMLNLLNDAATAASHT